MLIQLTDSRTLYTHNQLYGRCDERPHGELPRIARTLRLALHTVAGSAPEARWSASYFGMASSCG